MMARLADALLYLGGAAMIGGAWAADWRAGIITAGVLLIAAGYTIAKGIANASEGN